MTIILDKLYRSNRIKSWLLGVFLVYSMLGFFLVPWMIARSAANIVQDQLDSRLAVGDIQFNPYALSLRVTDLSFFDNEDMALLDVGEIYVNFELSSMVHRAWTFDKVQIATPTVYIDRNEAGGFNFDYLLEQFAGQQADVAEGASSAMPRVLLHKFALTDAVLNWVDEVPSADVTTTLGPIQFEVTGLSTIPDRSADHEILITTETEGILQWTGSVSLNPLESAGHVTLSTADFPLFSRYFRNDLGLNISDGHIGVELDYSLASADEKDLAAGLSAAIENLNISLSNVVAEVFADATSDPNDSDRELVRIPSLRVIDGSLAWPAREVAVGAIILDETHVSLLRDEDGVLNLLKIPPVTSTTRDDVANTAPTDDKPGWQLALQSLEVNQLSAELSDLSVNSHRAVGITDMRVRIQDLNNQPGSRFPMTLDSGFLHQGELRLQGYVTVLPEPAIDLDFSVQQFGLSVVEPYIQSVAHVGLDGSLDLDGKLAVSRNESLKFDGDFSVSDLLLNDSLESKELARWKKMQVNSVSLSVSTSTVEVSEMLLDGFYGDIVIDEQGRLNAAKVRRLDSSSESVKEYVDVDDALRGDESLPFSVMVGRVVIENSSADFADFSLPLPFSVSINKLKGTISTISSASFEPASIDLTGEVDEFGSMMASGSITPLDMNANTSLDVSFQNVAVPKFSAYMIPFAGRAIDSGRLDLSLVYHVSQNQLESQNTLLLRDFKLGSKEKFEGAASLPLDLAVALLKNTEGNIDLSLPISGDVSDPQFSYGAVIGRVFSNLITKLVASPFTLLGKLVGFEGDELVGLGFAPGSHVLTPPQREKASKLAEALLLRPELMLQIGGVTDSRSDTRKLLDIRFENLLESHMKEMQTRQSEELRFADLRRVALEALYDQANEAQGFSLPALADLQSSFFTLQRNVASIKGKDKDDSGGAGDAGQEVFDELAYVNDIKHRLLEIQRLPEGELESLAERRVEAVRAVMLLNTGLEESRVIIVDIESAEIDESGLIPMVISLGQIK